MEQMPMIMPNQGMMQQQNFMQQQFPDGSMPCGDMNQMMMGNGMMQEGTICFLFCFLFAVGSLGILC